ncbi:hypothetical protein [Oerskovia paurometabola]|uniref:hypothetical protein n=1 Tax=Oerskovia paurometabola TaxID=162170 RepID=UPI0034404440
MATTPTGVEVPAGTDIFDPDGDLRALGASLEGRIIVPVANATARNAVASLVSPSPTEPLYVHRGDAPPGRQLEVTTNGTTWITVGAQHDWMEFVATGDAVVNSGAILGSGIYSALVGGPLPYATRLRIDLAVTAGFDSSAVDVGIEVVRTNNTFVAPVQMAPQPVRAPAAAWAGFSHMATVDLPALTAWEGYCVARTSGPSAYYRVGMHVTRVPA